MSNLPWIMHVDMDAFFAAIEQRDDPSLRGKPVVVGAEPGVRGVVATCSYEARRFGIHSAMPINEAYRRCPGAHYLRPDMARYVAASRAVMESLETISPVVERVSIDEAYVDVTGQEQLVGAPEQIAATTQRCILEAVGLSASVGLGPNRLIAKLASDYRKPGGVTVVRPEGVLDFLGPMPVGKLRGIGERTARALERLGLRTVAELRAWSPELLAAHFGAKGAELLYQQSRGIGSAVVGDSGPRKSISRETTFPEDVRDWTVLTQVLLELAADVGRRARAEGFAGRVVTLKIRFPGFETHTRRRTLEQPTNHDRPIYLAARSLTEEWAAKSKSVRLIGVGLSEWGAAEPRQPDLFAPAPRANRDQRLYAALDDIQRRFGKRALRLGVPDRKPSC